MAMARTPVRAREDRNTHRPTIEGKRQPLREGCGFLLLSLFMGCNSTIDEAHRVCPSFTWGDSFVSSLSFSFSAVVGRNLMQNTNRPSTGTNL